MAEPHESDTAAFIAARDAARAAFGDAVRQAIQTAADRAAALSAALNAWAASPVDQALRQQAQAAQTAMVSAWQSLGATATQAVADRDAAINSAAAALKAAL